MYVSVTHKGSRRNNVDNGNLVMKPLAAGRESAVEEEEDLPRGNE